MKRRRFVSGVSASLATIVLGVGCGDDGHPVSVGAPSLVGALGVGVVSGIGRSYLSQSPAEQTLDALQRSLARAMRRARAHWWSPSPRIDQLVASDFENGHTVFVDGWMLSVNEARQCAIVALTTT